MQERRFLQASIIVGLCLFNVMHGSAQSLTLLVDQYYNNTHLIADLDLNRTRLEHNTTDLNALVTALEEQIQQSENNSTLLKTEISALDRTIQKDSTKKNITERNLHLITVLSKKVPTMFLGIIAGIISGLWIVSIFLFLLWRN